MEGKTKWLLQELSSKRVQFRLKEDSRGEDRKNCSDSIVLHEA